VKKTKSFVASNDISANQFAGAKVDELSENASAIKKSISSLETEQHQFHGITALNWFHWIILFGSLIVTLGAWYFSSSTIAAEVESRFERQHEQVVALLGERLGKYEDALWSGVAASQTVNRIFSRSEWKRYADTLDIGYRHPGISGIGLIVPKKTSEVDAYVRSIRQTVPNFNVHPSHEGDESLIISQIEPSEINSAALGLDVAFEVNRREGAYRSRDSGEAIITGPIVLVQDKKKTPGFLFYAPAYTSSGVSNTTDRQNTFSHWVYAPFIMSELIQGVLDKNSREIGIRITDNGEQLYSERSNEDELTPAELSAKQSKLDMYGRQWVVEAWPSESFYSHTESNQPMLILLGGLTIDAILLLTFLLMTRSNRRILSLAQDLATASDHLNTKSQELQQSNVELQSFACVASHDLKSPLVGIRYLTEILEEDLQLASVEPPISADISDNINRIRRQADRMSQLIDGILDYSSVGNGKSNIELVDVAELLVEIREDLQLSTEQIVCGNELPVLYTNQLPLKQVLENLISNAIKYHPHPETAVVNIIVEDLPGYHQFAVSDTGPGIDPQYHERIFNVFETLNTNQNIDSTGVGLAIVKKIVETHGGVIQVSSTLGNGSTFTFTWPKSAPGSYGAPDLKLAS